MILRVAVTLVVLSGLAIATAWTVQVARADWFARQETTFATEAAIRLIPDQAEYYEHLAILSSNGQEAVAMVALRHATELKPSDAPAWIEMGLRYESQGEIALAEQNFLRAVSEDKQYLPRWTLVNFYFRQGNTSEFWRWAKLSTEMIYGDPRPLFRLCGKVSEDGKLIDRLDLSPDLQADYLRYLVDQGMTKLLRDPLNRVIENRRPKDSALLMLVCDRFLAEHRPKEALDIWNRLAASNLTYFQTLNLAQSSLTNGSFEMQPSSHGFDWRVPETTGVTVSTMKKSQGIRVTFSGQQPESSQPLAQLIPVIEKSRYELKFLYRTSGIAPGSGLRWRVIDEPSGKALAEGESLSSDSEGQGRLVFATPANTGLIRLALTYQRAIGTTRIEGLIALRELELNLAR